MNLSIFLMAGSEVTSISLAVLFYALAMYPEEQERLIAEIDEHYPPAGIGSIDVQGPTYENIQDLVYLDYFIKETLRMWPIANTACTRRCVNRTTLKGIDIPENLTVIADVLSIHYDPELWGPVDPSVFYPMRLDFFGLVNYF
jgi:cytochrome P450